MKIPQSSNSLVQNGDKEYLNKLNHGLKDRIKLKEKELEDLESYYEMRSDGAKLDGEEQYVSTLNQNQQRIESALNDYENKIKNYQNQLIETKGKLKAEEESLRQTHALTMDNFKRTAESNFTDQYDQLNEAQNNILMDNNGKIKDLGHYTKVKMTDVKNKSEQDISKLAHMATRELNQKNLEYQLLLDGQSKKHINQIKDMDQQHAQTLSKGHQEHKRIMEDRSIVNESQLKTIDQYHVNLMRQKDTDFKIKYENSLKEHQSILSGIQKKFDEEVKSLLQTTTEQKRSISSKADDQFYRISTIDPKITENESEMLFELKVPPHERDTVILSVQGRGVKISLTRKFQAQVEDAEGNLNKSARSELITKEFPVKDILNPQAITQKYEDGILKVKVKKL